MNSNKNSNYYSFDSNKNIFESNIHLLGQRQSNKLFLPLARSERATLASLIFQRRCVLVVVSLLLAKPNKIDHNTVANRRITVCTLFAEAFRRLAARRAISRRVGLYPESIEYPLSVSPSDPARNTRSHSINGRSRSGRKSISELAQRGRYFTTSSQSTRPRESHSRSRLAHLPITFEPPTTIAVNVFFLLFFFLIRTTTSVRNDEYPR